MLDGGAMTDARDGAFDPHNPLRWFLDSFKRAQAQEVFDASRASLATVDAQGAPCVRFVLVRSIGERGFGFFTNLNSPKAQQAQDNPRAALAFHWSSISEQVRVWGPVEAIEEAEADTYFAGRPRENQLGAWASDQSRPIADRAALQERYTEIERRFADKPVPRPPHWSGLRIVPQGYEFWIGREGRLHDRWACRRVDGNWVTTRLQP